MRAAIIAGGAFAGVALFGLWQWERATSADLRADNATLARNNAALAEEARLAVLGREVAEAHLARIQTQNLRLQEALNALEDIEDAPLDPAIADFLRGLQP